MLGVKEATCTIENDNYKRKYNLATFDLELFLNTTLESLSSPHMR